MTHTTNSPAPEAEPVTWLPRTDAVIAVANDMAEMLLGKRPTPHQKEQAATFLLNCIDRGALSPLASARSYKNDRIASLEHALLEIIGTADEYKAMPCDSLERRFFSTVERYRSVVEKD